MQTPERSFSGSPALLPDVFGPDGLLYVLLLPFARLGYVALGGLLLVACGPHAQAGWRVGREEAELPARQLPLRSGRARADRGTPRGAGSPCRAEGPECRPRPPGLVRSGPRTGSPREGDEVIPTVVSPPDLRSGVGSGRRPGAGASISRP